MTRKLTTKTAKKYPTMTTISQVPIFSDSVMLSDVVSDVGIVDILTSSGPHSTTHWHQGTQK